MVDTVAIADVGEEVSSGFRFSWGLAFAGGIGAAAVTFILLTLGSGFGLLLVHPLTQSTRSIPGFLTGGAIYFFVAQAFGFAVGGHIAGRLLVPELETRAEENFRAGAHGFLAWAIAVVMTLTVVVIAGLAAGSAATASLYGGTRIASAENSAGATGYLVDKLFRPASGTGPSGDAYMKARGEASRIIEAGFTRGEVLASDDRERLVSLVSPESGLSADAASGRIDALQSDVQDKTRKAADMARKAASYASLWVAFSLLFGAIVSVFAAMLAQEEHERQILRT